MQLLCGISLRAAGWCGTRGKLPRVSEKVRQIETGCEWIVDAHGCDRTALQSLDVLQGLFALAIGELGLRPIADGVWHQFPDTGGITGVVVLSESHLTCHTFPERQFAAFNLYCCRPRPDWPWAERLAEAVGATDVRVNVVRRPGLQSGN